MSLRGKSFHIGSYPAELMSCEHTPTLNGVHCLCHHSSVALVCILTSSTLRSLGSHLCQYPAYVTVYVIILVCKKQGFWCDLQSVVIIFWFIYEKMLLVRQANFYLSFRHSVGLILSHSPKDRKCCRNLK